MLLPEHSPPSSFRYPSGSSIPADSAGEKEERNEERSQPSCCYLTRERAEKVSVYRDYYGTPECGTDVIAIEWNDGGTRARRWRRPLQTSRDSYADTSDKGRIVHSMQYVFKKGSNPVLFEANSQPQNVTALSC